MPLLSWSLLYNVPNPPSFLHPGNQAEEAGFRSRHLMMAFGYVQKSWEQTKDVLTFGTNERLREEAKGWDTDMEPYAYNVVVVVGESSKGAPLNFGSPHPSLTWWLATDP